MFGLGDYVWIDCLYVAVTALMVIGQGQLHHEVILVGKTVKLGTSRLLPVTSQVILVGGTVKLDTSRVLPYIDGNVSSERGAWIGELGTIAERPAYCAQFTGRCIVMTWDVGHLRLERKEQLPSGSLLFSPLIPTHPS